VSPEASPPVCKIINYDKLRYEEEKKQKMMRKNSKNAELKEVKLSYKIDVHDYEVRQRAASKFIVKGDKARPCPRAVLLRPCDAAPGRPRGSS
jgi:translation initiation factor IF-3